MTKLARTFGAENADGKIVIDPARLKTIITVLGSAVVALCSLVGGLTAVWSAPRRIDAVQQQVQELCAVDTVVDKRLTLQEQGLSNVAKTLEDIRRDISELRADIRTMRR